MWVRVPPWVITKMQSEMKIPSPDEKMKAFVDAEKKQIIDKMNDEDELEFSYILYKDETYGGSTRVILNNVSEDFKKSGWCTSIFETDKDVSLYIRHQELEKAKAL